MRFTSFLLSIGIIAVCAAASYGDPATSSSKTTCAPPGATCAPPPANGSTKDSSSQSKSSKTAKASKDAVPDVVYPYSFSCPHCGMKITVADAADWKKDCTGCACGLNKLGCYNAIKKPKS